MWYNSIGYEEKMGYDEVQCAYISVNIRRMLFWLNANDELVFIHGMKSTIL